MPAARKSPLVVTTVRLPLDEKERAAELEIDVSKLIRKSLSREIARIEKKKEKQK